MTSKQRPTSHPTARLPAVPLIDPNHVFTRESLTATLGLCENTVGREVRKGRLRVSRSAGSYWILGKWVIDWIEGGELQRRHRQRLSSTRRNGDLEESKE
jgi:hypothetical protein